MTEILQNFFRGISEIFNNEKTTLEEKIDTFVKSYTALLKQQPDLPLFIFHELRMDPTKLASKMGVNMIFKSYFVRQLTLEIDRRKIARIQPLHYIINMISMCVFPFIAAPLLKHIAGLDTRQYESLIDERVDLVPRWMNLMMKPK
jgi:hypothetical protein